MLTGRTIWRATAMALLCASGALGQAAGPAQITLKQYTYQSVRTPPFNGLVAFYAPDIRSSGRTVQLPVTISLLIGNGRRPFPTDEGTMKEQEFSKYKAQLLLTKSVREIPFIIQKKGEQLTFQYLGRSFVVIASDLVPCTGCDDRVVLTVQQAGAR